MPLGGVQRGGHHAGNAEIGNLALTEYCVRRGRHFACLCGRSSPECRVWQQCCSSNLPKSHSIMNKSILLLTAALLFALTPARAEDSKGGNPVMHTLGALGAQGVFSTYMSIAELADLYGAKTYDKQKAL